MHEAINSIKQLHVSSFGLYKYEMYNGRHHNASIIGAVWVQNNSFK